jgi:N-methylhydantoinase A/oxoprolinase/acetone carboxylase beta subunit
MLRIGIDIGGTFTDFAVWRQGAGGDTAIESFKVPSSPPHCAEAVREGLGHEAGVRQPLMAAVQNRLSEIGEAVDRATLKAVLAEEFERLTGQSAPPTEP